MSPVATPAVNEQEGPQQEPSSHNITSLVLAIPRDIWKRSRQVLSAIQLATETSTELLFKRRSKRPVTLSLTYDSWQRSSTMKRKRIRSFNLRIGKGKTVIIKITCHTGWTELWGHQWLGVGSSDCQGGGQQDQLHPRVDQGVGGIRNEWGGSQAAEVCGVHTAGSVRTESGDESDWLGRWRWKRKQPCWHTHAGTKGRGRRRTSFTVWLLTEGMLMPITEVQIRGMRNRPRGAMSKWTHGLWGAHSPQSHRGHPTSPSWT